MKKLLLLSFLILSIIGISVNAADEARILYETGSNTPGAYGYNRGGGYGNGYGYGYGSLNLSQGYGYNG